MIKGIPLPLIYKACWLNQYRTRELILWWETGVKDWQSLSKYCPAVFSVYQHKRRRQHWPDKCKAAKLLLSDKAALLKKTPSKWRSPYLEISNKFSTQTAAPDWWSKALVADGVVLKPLRGYGGQGVMRFRWSDEGLEQEALINHYCMDTVPLSNCSIPCPKTLLTRWQQLCNRHVPALASPYLRHSYELPETDPSTVVRVITSRSSPQAYASVEQIWLEVPLGDGSITFMDRMGFCLPKLGKKLSDSQQNFLDQWKDLLRKGVPPCVSSCMEAAVAMHMQVPPIDRVAWDWIPRDDQPLLLEGNGEFDLFVPELFNHCHSSAQPSIMT